MGTCRRCRLPQEVSDDHDPACTWHPSRRISIARTFSLVCGANGCVFLRQGLPKREAEVEATRHMRLAGAGHDVSMVEAKGSSGSADK